MTAATTIAIRMGARTTTLAVGILIIRVVRDLVLARGLAGESDVVGEL